MLELRPSCENCNKELPANSIDAMICSYECTFCSDCVTKILFNVCPNCGGGFCSRPIRPHVNRKDDNYLGNDPASTLITFKPIDIEKHKLFSDTLKVIPPEDR